MITCFTHNRQMLEYNWNELYPDIFCFSTTRHGGCSVGEYASFNCYEYGGDVDEAVMENRRRLLGILPEGTSLIVPHQTHGDKVQVVDAEFLELDENQRKFALEGVDALVTDRPGVCIGVSTADCIPVFFYDPVKQAVAVAHAGWRGTCLRIVSRTVEEMSRRYGTCPGELRACIGPGISMEAFEVGDEVWQQFKRAGFPMERIARRYQKWHINLWEANRWILEDCGVPGNYIMESAICTWNNNSDFFSARRQGIASGRIFNGIMIRK